MSLNFSINRQFLDQLYRKDFLLAQGFKTTNESCFIPKYKLSLGISFRSKFKMIFFDTLESNIKP